MMLSLLIPAIIIAVLPPPPVTVELVDFVGLLAIGDAYPAFLSQRTNIITINSGDEPARWYTAAECSRQPPAVVIPAGLVVSLHTTHGVTHYDTRVESPGPTDLNRDGVSDPDDLRRWLAMFDAGDIRADVNEDGGITIDDLLYFLSMMDAETPR